MRISTFLAAAVMAVTPIAATAEGWNHVGGTMGQFEGFYQSRGFAIEYGCADNFSTLTFVAEGPHVAPGVSEISVDGEDVASGNTVYHSKFNRTMFKSDIEAEWRAARKEDHNALIEALASGRQAIWTLPTGLTLRIDLTGSAGIRACGGR